MTAETFREIKDDDVGKPFIMAFGKAWSVADFMGRIMPRDVGKLIYKRGDILQVENDDQLRSRRAVAEANRAATFARPGDVANLILERDALRRSRDELLGIVKWMKEMFDDGADKIYRDGIAYGDDDTTLHQHVNNAVDNARRTS